MGGINKSQWTVIGMLIMLLAMEAVLNPSIQGVMINVWHSFNLPKSGPSPNSDTSSLPATAPKPKDGNDIGANVVPTQDNPMIRSWRG